MSSFKMCHPFVEVVSRRLNVLSDFTAADKKLNIKSMWVFLYWVLVLLDSQKKKQQQQQACAIPSVSQVCI